MYSKIPSIGFPTFVDLQFHSPPTRTFNRTAKYGRLTIRHGCLKLYETKPNPHPKTTTSLLPRFTLDITLLPFNNIATLQLSILLCRNAFRIPTMEGSTQNSGPSYSDVPYNKRWELLKPYLEKLYIQEKRKLSDIVDIMKSQHKFYAS
jgi:Clr5 domain